MAIANTALVFIKVNGSAFKKAPNDVSFDYITKQ